MKNETVLDVFVQFFGLVSVIIVMLFISFWILTKFKEYKKYHYISHSSTMKTIYLTKRFAVDLSIDTDGWVLPIGFAREYKKYTFGILCVFFTIKLK